MTGIRTIVLFAAISAVFAGIPLRKGHRAGGPSPNPIGTTPPNFAGGQIANDAPPGPFFQDFQPPFPTDSWWSGLTVTNQNAVLAGPFPFQSATTNTGLLFGISDTREFDGTSVKVPTQEDWRASIDGLPDVISNRKATAWDTQTVCLQYFNGGSTMDTCLVPGSPYMTLTFQNAGVVLTSLQGNILSFEWVDQGTKAKVTNEGGTYIIYSINGAIELTAGDTTLTSPGGFSGTLRIAKLKEASQEGVLDAHRATYPTGHTMSYNVAGDISTQTWTWDVVGNPAELLIMSWPHHRKGLQGPNYANIEYLTLKGIMRGVIGNTWVQRHELPTISWFAQNAPHASCVSELSKTLEAEVNALEVMIPGDFYFWGGALGRASRLALIAEHIGRNDLIDQVVTVLKTSIEYWFDPDHTPHAAFETGWGGFINKEGWNNTWVDFGNAYYNDHHFHYGYLLQGGATVGKYDPGWMSQHHDFFEHVARNVGNPSPNDPHYAVTRHMDFFAGHSWASGIANGAGPRDQESSGEAINGYYGLLLWAHSVNNQALIDWSRLVLAMEIAGAQEYWHLYPSRPDTPYPEPAFRDLITVGNVMDTQAGAWLFWGDQRTQIAAIQILPLTPIGQYTFDVDWMANVVPYCQAELDDVTIGDAFKSVIWAAYAKVNPQEAYRHSEELFEWGSGNSASNQLYFVSTQTSSDDICLAGAQTPEGLYWIQDAATNQYVTVAGNGQLAATTVADVLAAKFTLGFTPGGGTIKAASSQKYVTASPDATQPLSANRDTAQGYETFRWAVQPDGTYLLTAMVNRAQVTTSPGTGQLLNNANSTNGIQPSRYRLIEAEDTGPIEIPASGRLKSRESNKHVVSTFAVATLLASADAVNDGTLFLFERIPESPVNAPLYAIKNSDTNLYVTGNPEGNVPLTATSPAVQLWEDFEILPYQGGYILLHIASGLAVAVQPDTTLLNNNNSIDGSALWDIVV